MAGGPAEDAAAVFDPLRPKLVRIAYRMLGSVADAEDVVQEAFIRWMGVDRAGVAEPAGYLTRIVTRLCLDQLKSARRKREIYVGPWLPDPVVEAEEDMADDITLPLMLALERLSPLERASFLLHDVFGVSFEEIAETLDREPAACRQLAARARENVRAERPRFEVSNERGKEIAAAFFNASRTGDMAALQSILAADVVMHSDGGGKRPAAAHPIVGREKVLHLHRIFAAFFVERGSKLVDIVQINGLPGFISMEADGLQTTAFDVEDGRIKAIYIMRNPDKLAHLSAQPTR
jgi:RNA polymerase sigma-70 factor (ECF subfamily)